VSPVIEGEVPVAEQNASTLLRQLEHRHVAPKGERAVDVELAAAPGADSPEPVLLLTNAALYARAATAKDWSRLPINRIDTVRVSSDCSGMLTRYSVVDHDGLVQVDMALPMARESFRERMESLAVRTAQPPSPAPTVTVARAAVLPSATGWVVRAA